MRSSDTHEFVARLARHIPGKIRFGTSTWTYPGWRGSIYKEAYSSDSQFRKTCLAEYARYPLFRTVGIDSFFYNPPTEETLLQYASQVPEDFTWLQKVWEHITTPAFPAHKRYGSRAGQRNQDFLNADLFGERVLTPNLHPDARPHAGPFLFQFPTIAKSILAPEQFFEQLSAFFDKLPAEFQYAVEIRNPEYLQQQYFDVLNTARVTHCFNHWNYMPSLLEQMKSAASAGGIAAPFFVTRLLTPANVSYQQAVSRFKPYDSLKSPNPQMRADVTRLIRRAIQRNIPAFVIVNNRCEGFAPGTISALAESLKDAPGS